MNFTNPLFLYGLFALSIPIIVHLFNFRKAKKVYFSNTQFLKKVKETSSAKRRLKHYLVLFCRLLFLFFLVMAFAQPYLSTNENGLSNNSVCIYMDDSYSMSNLVSDEISALDEGILYINEIINLYPKGTQFRFITNEFAPFANSLKSSIKIEDYTTEIKMSSIGRKISEVLARIESLSASQGINSEDIYVISDFQKSTAGDISSITFDSSKAYHLVPIKFNRTANISIDTVYVKNPFILNQDKTEIEIIVRNAGKEEQNGVNIRVYINNVQMSSATIDVPGESTKVLNFDLVYDLHETNRVNISIDDYPVSFDNDFYLTLKSRPKVHIVEIKDKEGPTVIEKVYANRQLFDLETYQISNIDYSEVEYADLVIVNQIPQMSVPLIHLLKEFYRNGGRLAYIPHEESDAKIIKELVPGVSVEKLNSQSTNELSMMTKIDLNNPFFANIFEQKQSEFGMPKGRPLFKWSSRANSLIQYNNKTTFLSHFTQNGHFYLFASPFEDEFTDFAKHALFVPIMYKIATHGLANNLSLYQRLDASQLIANLDTVHIDNVYKIVQGRKELIPDQRINGKQIILQIPRHALEAGFADLTYQKDTLELIALNYNNRESILEQYTSDDLNQKFGDLSMVTIFQSDNANAFSKEINEKYLGVKLWKYALLLALLFLVLEAVIIRFYKQKL